MIAPTAISYPDSPTPLVDSYNLGRRRRKRPRDKAGANREGRFLVMDVQFIASVSVIAPDPAKSRELFVDALGLPLEARPGDDYFHSERIPGSKHFGVWPLAQAAEACFGSAEWPDERPLPQVSLEFEVEDARAVQAAAEELRAKGFTLLHEAREEPWGQTVARLQSVEGAVIGISFAPWLHD